MLHEYENIKSPNGSEYFKAHLVCIAGCAANLVNAWETVSW